MGSLTLVPDTIAQAGHRFWFRGANAGAECDGCPVRDICFRLTPGRHYEVQQVRKVTHPCNLHDEGRVRVCLVEEVPFRTSIQQKHLRGTAVTWDPVPCGYAECDKFALCHPLGPAAGARYAIKETGSKIACPMHYDIRDVVLEPME